MESFELKVDTNTIYIKTTRFLGTLALGFFIGIISMKYTYEGTIEWMSAFIGILGSLSLAFYPGIAKKHTLIVNDEGIFLKNYRSLWSGKKEYSWSTIKAVEVKKNRIEFKKSIGSTEKIKLPIHTGNQIKDLKNYLQQLTNSKEIAYNGR